MYQFYHSKKLYYVCWKRVVIHQHTILCVCCEWLLHAAHARPACMCGGRSNTSCRRVVYVLISLTGLESL